MSNDERVIEEIIEELVNQLADEGESELVKLEGNTESVEKLEEEIRDCPEDFNRTLRLINLEQFKANPFENKPRVIGTRSNKNIDHTSLTAIKRTRNKKMAPNDEYLSYTDAIKTIPKYSGDAELHPFINVCEKVLESVDEARTSLLIKMIVASKLTGKAYNATKHKTITTWAEVKKILLDNFELPYAVDNLQMELYLLKMGEDEPVVSYNARAEEIYQKLSDSQTVGETSSDAIAIRRNTTKQALNSYIRGLTGKIQFKVEIRNPQTLESAMQLAISAERDIINTKTLFELSNPSTSKNNEGTGQSNRNYNRNNLFSKNYNNGYNNNYRPNNNNFRQGNNNLRPNNYNNYNPNRYNNNDNPRNNNNTNRREISNNNIRCYNCNKEGHYASQCRNRNNFNHFTRPPTSFNNGITCTYCLKIGHDLSSCYKRRNDEQRNNRNTNVATGNESGSNASGLRSIQQIMRSD